MTSLTLAEDTHSDQISKFPTPVAGNSNFGFFCCCKHHIYKGHHHLVTSVINCYKISTTETFGHMGNVVNDNFLGLRHS